MRRLLLIPVCFFALAVPVVVLANGPRGGFDGIVASIEERYHVHAERIPFVGFISFVSRRATQGGVSGVHVAEIDNFQTDVDGEELNKIVEEKLGAGWERVIRETSRNGSNQTLIFMHPEDRRMVFAELTEKGRKFIAWFTPLHREFTEQIGNCLSDKEKVQLTKWLDTLRAHIQSLPSAPIEPFVE